MVVMANGPIQIYSVHSRSPRTVANENSYRNSVFSLAFFSMAGCHAVNLGRYAVLQATTLSFEQRGG